MNATKEKIQLDYVKKTKQMETQNAIARSTAINRSRIEKIRSQQEALAKIQHESTDALIQELKNGQRSKEIHQKLIIQGMLMLLEDEVQVRCRACDDKTVKSCLSGAMEEYKKVI